MAKAYREGWKTGLANVGDCGLFELRNALRSGDIWLADSRRYREITTALVPIEAVARSARLTVPLDADEWLDTRSKVLENTMLQIASAIRLALSQVDQSSTANFK